MYLPPSRTSQARYSISFTPCCTASVLISFRSGCNQYTSMSFTEFGNLLLTGKMGSDTLEDTGNETSNGGAGGRKLQQTYPPTVDWVAAGKVTAVRNQRKCGSSWAFAGLLPWNPFT